MQLGLAQNLVRDRSIGSSSFDHDAVAVCGIGNGNLSAVSANETDSGFPLAEGFGLIAVT